MGEDGNTEVLWLTQRKKVLAAFEQAKEPFLANTKPLKSYQQLRASVVDVQNPAGNPLTGFFLFARGQTLTFFGYGEDEAVPYGQAQGALSGTRVANEADTNLSRGKQTNTEDFIIEGISCSCRGTRISYPTASIPVTYVNPSVLNALQGAGALLDPGSVVSPPQVNSPFNLENVMFEAVKPYISFELKWDKKRIEQLGTLDQVPEGAAKSFLRSSGTPRTDNRYKIPEGYLWRRQGEPDSLFTIRATLQEDVLVPINLVPLSPAAGALNVAPNFAYVELLMRLHGLAIAVPSQN